jgi:carboxypeptidase family protein
VVVVFLLLAGAMAHADTPPPKHTIRGRVIAEGEPVFYAIVIVLGTRLGSVTDTCGWFAIDGVPCGQQLLKAQCPGCRPVVLRVDPCTTDTLVVVNTKPEFSPPPCPAFFSRPEVPRFYKGAGWWVVENWPSKERIMQRGRQSTLALDRPRDPCTMHLRWTSHASAVLALLDPHDDLIEIMAQTAAGRGRLDWNGRLGSGAILSRGVYQVRLASAGDTLRIAFVHERRGPPNCPPPEAGR